MVELIRTDSGNPDFIELVERLDAYLAVIDGDDHAFYSQFNKINKLKYAVVAYHDGRPAGCGAIREFAPGTMEIKRMYTSPDSRGQGIATRVLAELERWAAELSCSTCILETGNRQPDAIALYQKNGYQPIPNYGQYAAIGSSVCFQKEINNARSQP